MTKTNTLPAMVDELTELNTQIAVLTARADKIKADLAATGLDEVCGSNTRAVISRVDECYRADWKAVAGFYKPTAEVVSKFQIKVAASVRISVKGYNARRAA